jgi:protoporphyrinogen oxidase
MNTPAAVVLGAGLSGLAAAHALAQAGWRDVVVLERGDAAGGLAGSFERDGCWYPLGYHHILQKDDTLLQFLHDIGAADRVQWRRVRMLFEVDRVLYDLGTPHGFASFPMPWRAKAMFVRLMLRAFRTSDWSAWEGRSARELIDEWGDATVRRILFEPLCRLKFRLGADDVSAAWLGARLHFREGSAPLGYIAGANWTKVLCDGVADMAARAGVRIHLRTGVTALDGDGKRVNGVVLQSGERLHADVVVSTVPPPVYLTLIDDGTPALQTIRYTALLSAVCAAPPVALPSFYWLNLSSLRSTASAIFRLDALNPTIGRGNEMCINFVTHLADSGDPLFSAPEQELMVAYRADFSRSFGAALTPSWVHLARVPMYSPVFDRGFRNPPVRSTTWENVYFAGNYRTFPSVASTGTALSSGIVAASAILADHERRPFVTASMQDAA